MPRPSLGPLVPPVVQSAAASVLGLVLSVLLGSCGKIAKEYVEFVGLDRLQRDRATGSSIVVSPGGDAIEVVEGKGPLVVKLTRVRPDDRTLTIDFETRAAAAAPISATPDLDYLPKRGRLTWGPGDGSEKVVEVDIVDDEFFEFSEVFGLGFSAVVNGETIQREITCVIRDRSAPPRFVSDTATVSARKGGAQFLTLRAGPAHAGRPYVILGSFAPTPGFQLGGWHVPLNPDPWFEVTVVSGNSQMFHRFRGTLPASGSATAAIHIAPIANPRVIGLKLFHAFVVYDPAATIHMVSEPVSLTIVE